MKRRIWFEACSGGGYFYDHQDGRCPWLTRSMEVAEAWLHLLIQEHDLTPKEIEMAGAEIRAAGLREKASAEELAILLR